VTMCLHCLRLSLLDTRFMGLTGRQDHWGGGGAGLLQRSALSSFHLGNMSLQQKLFKSPKVHYVPLLVMARTHINDSLALFQPCFHVKPSYTVPP